MLVLWWTTGRTTEALWAPTRRPLLAIRAVHDLVSIIAPSGTTIRCLGHGFLLEGAVILQKGTCPSSSRRSCLRRASGIGELRRGPSRARIESRSPSRQFH